jgi:hypothetical protein
VAQKHSITSGIVGDDHDETRPQIEVVRALLDAGGSELATERALHNHKRYKDQATALHIAV